MRVERIGECELWLADCREVLPTLGRVDAVVTDLAAGAAGAGPRGPNGGGKPGKTFAMFPFSSALAEMLNG